MRPICHDNRSMVMLLALSLLFVYNARTILQGAKPATRTSQPTEQLQQHIDNLKSQLDGRTEFVDELVKIGSPAVEQLINEMEDENTNVNARMSIARVLGKIRDRRALKPLFSKLHDKDYSVLEACAHALALIADDSIIPELAGTNARQEPFTLKMNIRQEKAIILEGLITRKFWLACLVTGL